MSKFKNDQKGLIRTIIIIIIAIVILSYFGFDLKNIFTSEQVQKNLSYVWNFIVNIWTNYLSVPFSYLWGIWVEYIWRPLLDILSGWNSSAPVE